MADAGSRAAQRGLSYAATGAALGSAIPGVGTLIGAGVGGLFGAVSGWMEANKENEQLQSAEAQATKAINDAADKLAAADAEQKAALQAFIEQQKTNLGAIRERRQQLAKEMSAARLAGIAQEEEAMGKGFTSLEEALKQQESGYDVSRQLQLEGIGQREALLGTEESAARRITAPGGLLERQQQQNALARAQAMQKARLGGPAARAALMGQFATQGAQLGMNAQQQIADAQAKVREGRMGLIGERTGAELERQRGLMDLYGRRGSLGMQRAESAAGYIGRRTDTEAERLQGLSNADVEYQTGLGDLGSQEYNALTDLRSRGAERGAGQIRDISDTQLARQARAMQLDAAEADRNVKVGTAAMGLMAANPTALTANAVPSWMSGAARGFADWLNTRNAPATPPPPPPPAAQPAAPTNDVQRLGVGNRLQMYTGRKADGSSFQYESIPGSTQRVVGGNFENLPAGWSGDPAAAYGAPRFVGPKYQASAQQRNADDEYFSALTSPYVPRGTANREIPYPGGRRYDRGGL